MKPKEFARLVERDGYCLHCGEREAIAPNHRINRGMGGSSAAHVHAPSNLVVLCSRLNGEIEASVEAIQLARKYGWKLDSWDNPEEVPVFDRMSGVWYLLDNEFGRIVLD